MTRGDERQLVEGATGGNAFDEVTTRRYWLRALQQSRLILTLWLLTLPVFGIVASAIEASGRPVPKYPLVPLVVVIAVAGIAASQTRWERIKRMRGILEVYPWQSHTHITQAAETKTITFRLPNPDNRGKSFNTAILFLDKRRWRRAMRGSSPKEIWFAGDPRFAAVVALPGPRHLTLIRQRGTGKYGESATRPRGVSAQAWEKAQTAKNKRKYGERSGDYLE